jgi:4-azaleucine resistance transporter AzlC
LRAQTVDLGPSAAGFAAGARAALPVVLGYLSIGFAAGVVERAAGLGVVEVLLLATVLYAGSAQFVAASMIAAASPPSAIVVTVLFVNLRHLLLSAALAPALARLPIWANALIGAQLTDETFVVAWNRMANVGRLTGPWMAGLNLSAWSTWGLANVAGALLGEALGDTRALGFDFALAAMFAALAVLQLFAGRADDAARRRARGIAVGVSAAIVSVVVALALPGNWNVIVATLCAATLGLAVERWTSGQRS